MNQMIPQYSTVLFSQVWNNQEDFLQDYLNSGFSNNVSSVKPENIKTLYLLLYAQYGNSPIANRDVNQFALKVFATIFKYGPSWERKLEIQVALRSMDDVSIREGNFTKFNHAFNPSTEPTTDVLSTVNDQNTTTMKRGLLEGYQALLTLLETDVTEEFINRFKPLFKQFVMPEDPLLYISEGEE